MSATKDGGAAFPQFEVVAGERDGHGDAIESYTVATGGMSLRDYFAAAALTGILVHMRDMTPSLAAVDAFKAADAMLKTRQQNGGAA